MKNPSNEFVVSCVLNIDWWKHYRRVHSPFSCMSSWSDMIWYGVKKTYKCHVKRISSHLISLSVTYLWGSRGRNHLIPPPFFSRAHGGYWSQSQLSLWAKAGYTLDKLPAHHRAFTDGRGCHARCQLHIRSNFGVQYLAQGCFDVQLSSAPGELGFEPATVRSLVDLSSCK